MAMTPGFRTVASVVAGAALVLTGCNSVSRAKYSKVSVGMDRDEVESILGKGTVLSIEEVDLTPFQQVRLGPPPEGVDPADMPTKVGLPSLKELKEDTTWVRWGNDEKKFILIGFIDDKVVAKHARIPY
jgi:hypothetical protein